MRPLVPPAVDSHRYFERIASAKKKDRRPRLQSMTESIRRHYLDYDTHRAELARLAPAGYAGVQKDDLLDCYEVGTAPLDELKTVIRQAQPVEIRGKCQYCTIFPPDTFDHYLPKSEYPEFAVCALNLIPCCGPCNRRKGNYCVTGGRRHIINLYFDVIPAGRYLRARLTFRAGVPVATFTLEKHPGMSDEMFELLTSHYARLGLLGCFSENSAEVFSEAKSSIRAHYRNAPGPEVRAYLRREAARLSEDFSENYWKAVLYEALSESTEFIDQCLAVPSPTV